MDSCCSGKSEALQQMRERQALVLKVLLAANLAMFVIEAAFGLLARSTALLGDSLDMFGDALVYGATLYVLHRSLRSKAKAALLKGGMLILLGLGVLVEAGTKLVSDARPEPFTMGWVGLLALTVNVGCLLLLLKHRDQDINMKSAWVCSRNDIIANVAVMASAGAVARLGSRWPDIVVGGGIAALFLRSAAQIVRDTLAELRASPRVLRPGSLG